MLAFLSYENISNASGTELFQLLQHLPATFLIFAGYEPGKMRHLNPTGRTRNLTLDKISAQSTKAFRILKTKRRSTLSRPSSRVLTGNIPTRM